jgi:hypothetical protein
MGYAKPYPKPEKIKKDLNKFAKFISKLATRKFIPKRSKKRIEQEKIYNARVKVWIVGKKCAVFPNKKATECHHVRGRWGKRLFEEQYWLPVSRAGHDQINNNPDWARENSFIIARSV